jgi:DNA-binding NtrC family response regulator
MMIQIDPLRKRPEDIPLLINYYYKKLAANFKDRPLKIISKDTIEKLKKYSWPGNIRELQNVLQHIQIHDINDEYLDEIFGKVHNKIPVENPQELPNISNIVGIAKSQNSFIPLKKIKKEIYSKVEKEIIPLALERSYYNVPAASKILGIRTKSLHLKLKEYGINSKPDEKYNNRKEFNGKLVEGIDFDYIFKQAFDLIKASNL